MLKLGWGGFWPRNAISRKRCEIELRWQLITNRKSHNGLSIATKVDDLEWPWASIHCFVVSVMRFETKRLRLQSLGFRYKVALDVTVTWQRMCDKYWPRHRSAYDETFCSGCRSAEYFGGAGWRYARILFLLIIFSPLMTQHVLV